MKQPNTKESGLAHLGLILTAVLVIAALAFAGWWVWDKNNKAADQKEEETQESVTDQTKDWIVVSTQKGGFNMKIPDGWIITRYPGDFLGTLDVTYNQGSPATVKNSDVDYFGHSLLFQAGIMPLDDAGLGPQWASPQPGLDESTEEFAIGSLQGKRYKGDFSQDLNQTIYEYVFDIGGGKKLDIVYIVDHSKDQQDDVEIVEKAISGINLRQ